MAKKTSQGIIRVTSSSDQASALRIELKPALPPKDGKPGEAAKFVQIISNDETLLQDFSRGKLLKLTLETV